MQATVLFSLWHFDADRHFLGGMVLLGCHRLWIYGSIMLGRGSASAGQRPPGAANFVNPFDLAGWILLYSRDGENKDRRAGSFGMARDCGNLGGYGWADAVARRFIVQSVGYRDRGQGTGVSQ